ncbi:helix-turn-helix domain-containing protein [Anaeropeptidivorans aminofermentans]|uniref:helix-turn-helix domain-containing protein n=1 Tax=Anaeropeptidivorans aminofermentans TaxID=2934315 RepID=UPI002024E7C8|nr:helix-turn-helix transcriptional regulator [Anaeropeptidivorans aminofermentans]
MAYKDFKSYLYANYKELIQIHIEAFINKNYNELGLSYVREFSLCPRTVEGIEIKSLCCHEDVDSRIRMEIYCDVKLVTLGFEKVKVQTNKIIKYFTVYAQATLSNKLEDFCIDNIKECNPDEFDKVRFLDEYLIPYIPYEQLEDEADRFYKLYCENVPYFDLLRLPIESIIEELGIEYYEAPLPKNVFGRMYFIPSKEEVYESIPYTITGRNEKRTVMKEIKAGTMLISHDNYFMKDIGSRLNTIAHEIIHWEKHQKFFKILSLLNENENSLSCIVEPVMTPNNLEGIQKAIWWAEWQANAIAPRILMPRAIFIGLFSQVFEEQMHTPHFRNGDIIEKTLDKVSKLFSVSKYAAKTRAIQLGIDVAEGAYTFVDNKYYPPVFFPIGTLGRNQTFIVDKATAQKLIEGNRCLGKLVENKAIIYTGSVFCINDSRYIEVSENSQEEYKLTQYALEHAEKCCLIFQRSFSKDVFTQEAELYSVFYLSRNVTASSYVEAYYDSKFTHNQEVEDIAAQLSIINKALAEVNKVIKELPDKFESTLKYHMKRKKISISKLAERTELSDTTIKNYTSGRVNPSLDNLMAIFIGLNLLEPYCDDMLDKAGYKLNNLYLHEIYRYLIKNHSDGNIKQWNDVLKAADFEKIPKNKLLEEPLVP